LSVSRIRRAARMTITISLALLLSGSCARPPVQWTPFPPPNTPKEFDVTYTKTDYNGSPLNIRWGAHANGQGLPPIKAECKERPDRGACTTQSPTLDIAQGLNFGVCIFDPSKIKGHVNWTVAASTGQLLWLNYASDSDYNFMFFPDDDAALTGNNGTAAGAVSPSRRFVELEFDSRETVRQFATKFWTEFDAVVRKHRRGPEINARLNPTRPGEAANAVVFGLLGLDCEHDCASEYHPVYALGIEIDPTPSNNRWAIFVRNWGNEGFCSRFNHELLLHDGKLRLTLPRLGTGPSVNSALTEFASTDGKVLFPAVEFDKQDRAVPADSGNIVLTFALPPPQERVTAELILTLQWTSTQDAPVARSRFDATGPGVLSVEEENTVEARLERVLGGAEPEQPDVLAVRQNTPLIPIPPVTVGAFTRPSFLQARPPASQLQIDTGKLTRDKALIRAVCDSPRASEAIPAKDVQRVCAEARK
jgi:hypothetical protein